LSFPCVQGEDGEITADNQRFPQLADLRLEMTPRVTSLEFINVSIESTLSASMQALRESSYGDRLCSADQFDPYSENVVAWNGSQPVAIVRITPAPYSMLRKSRPDCDIPTEPGTVELTRAIVRVTFRNKGLFRLVLLLALIRSHALGFATAFAGFNTVRDLRFLQRLGFEKRGTPLLFDDYVALRRNPTTCPKGQLSQIGGRWLA
jgi:hypothetical protein